MKDSNAICQRMGLCFKSQVGTELHRVDEIFNFKLESNVNCTLCKMIITQVKQMLLNNKKQSDIINYVNKNLCEKAGKSKEICKTFIDAYGPVFLEIIGRDIVSFPKTN